MLNFAAIMTNSFFKIALSLLVALSATSACSHKSGSDNSGNNDADTLCADTQLIDLQPAFLPDTVYPSANFLRSKTEILTPDIPGELTSTLNMYSNVPGVFTFRGGAYRDADFHGTVSGTPSEIEVVWKFRTDNSSSSERYGSWGGGSGWTGQPLYVNWPDSCVARFKAANTLLPDFGKQEIIVGSLAGKVYFINFNSGKASRKPIDVINVIKGTVSLDPTLNGNLYVGQGIPLQRPFGAVTINLYKHAVTHTFGEDPKAPRQWGAYDSSALRVGQFLFRPGENGTLYKWLVLPDKMQLHSTMSYTTATGSLGFEASMSVYSNYGFTADNRGNLVCTNLNTMRPVWRYDLGDDTDASPVLLIENGHPYIYTGSEIDKQGAGFAKFAKIDGLNGQPVWETKFEGRLAEVGSKHFDGGFYATALPGNGNCSDLLFTNVVRNLKGQNGEFIALERATGKVRYSVPLNYYAWSSPVGFLNENNEMFVFAADCSGYVYLFNGIDGKKLHCSHVGNNFESSPVVIGNELVVGSRGDTIFKLAIK